MLSFAGKLSHSELDERALDALKEFNPDDAVKVLQQFTESSLEHVTNKSAFLCGQMKTFRQKSKGGGPNAAPKGPDPDKIKVIKKHKELYSCIIPFKISIQE